MNDKTTLTMKDIARELGVSVATVSRALKNSPHISSEQRERIKQYAQEHHFTPNTATSRWNFSSMITFVPSRNPMR